MFFTQLKNTLFTGDTLEYAVIAGTFIGANIWSYQDENDHIAMTRFISSGHTLATAVTLYVNLKQSLISAEDRRTMSAAIALSSLSSTATAVGVWLVDDPMLNLFLGVGNASCNFLTKFITHLYEVKPSDLDFANVGLDDQKNIINKIYNADNTSLAECRSSIKSFIYLLDVASGLNFLYPAEYNELRNELDALKAQLPEQLDSAKTTLHALLGKLERYQAPHIRSLNGPTALAELNVAEARDPASVPLAASVDRDVEMSPIMRFASRSYSSLRQFDRPLSPPAIVEENDNDDVLDNHYCRMV